MIKSKQILKGLFSTGLFYLFCYYISAVKNNCEWYDVPTLIIIGSLMAFNFAALLIDYLKP
jgi:hypothetical protein